MNTALFRLCCLAVLLTRHHFRSCAGADTFACAGHGCTHRRAAPLNTITDVAGVLVGQTSIVRGDNIRTRVTAILPHGGNPFREKAPGAVFVGNAFGKLAGSTQVKPLGEIETTILLTCTLCAPYAADALIEYMLVLA
jgi:L-aminopeptidase/D-esterase-like protein